MGRNTSDTVEEHEQHLKILFSRLSQYGVIINPAKCEFGTSSLTFLGHVVDEDSIQLRANKVIQDFPVPDLLRKLREFLGLINFYRRFIPDCADIVQPFTDLLKSKTKNKAIVLDSATLTAFNKVKTVLVQATFLVHLRSTSPIFLMVDASDVASGGVLQQLFDDMATHLIFLLSVCSQLKPGTCIALSVVSY